MEDDGDPAERAFDEQARALVALKAAVDALRKAKAGPDYAPTLARITAIAEELKARPTTVTMDSGALGAEERAAVGAVLNGPLRDMQRGMAEVEGAARHFRSLNEHVRTERYLKEQNYWRGAAGVAGGALIWALLSGPLARRLPASWHVPEKMAAATLVEDRATAGQQMIASVNPQEWSRSIAAIGLYRTNREALDACALAATRAGKAQRCSMKVEPSAEGESNGRDPPRGAGLAR